MTFLLGVDVSHFQGHVDWNAARRAGVDFAFAKATQGTSFRDSEFQANITGMRNADVVPGAYHFLTSGSSAAQADWFCQNAPADVIHALDVEAKILDVATWVVRYRTHYPDKTLLIYTGRDLWAQAVGAGHDGSAFGPLWVAGYVANRYLGGGSLATVAELVGTRRGSCPFGGWEQPTFLQFTDKAQVPGIGGNVDGDLFYGTRAQLLALTASTPRKDPDVAEAQELTSQYQVDIYNALQTDPKKQKKIGDSLTATEVAYWGTIGDLRTYLRLQQISAKVDAQATASAARDAALLAAVQALAGGSADGVAAAFEAGTAALLAQLEALRITITTGG